MTTTTGVNPSTRNPAPQVNPTVAADGTITVFFRQSADGINFTVTPVFLHPTDAAHAVGHAPAEYSLGGTVFAAWPGSYNNSAQAVGGRGRLQGASNAAG